MPKPIAAIAIQDAEPLAWKGEKKPDMDPDLYAFLETVGQFFTAGQACTAHPPPYAGTDWAKKAKAYAEAREAMYAEWDRLKGAGN